MKSCATCKLDKPLDTFYKWLDKRNNVHRPQSSCKDCQKAKAKVAYKANPDKWNREEHLKRRYGLTILDYDVMLAKQKGVCCICKQPPKKRRLSVDHCHKTGRIRGLLCWNCNYRLLPTGKDSSELFQRAADYLATTN